MTSDDTRRTYLDYNATAPCRDEVIAAMFEAMDSSYGNPSSLHQEGRRARHLVERSRERIAAALGAEPIEIIFTSGGTEADNLAILGATIATSGTGRHIVSSNIEHPAVLKSCEVAESRGWAEVTYAKCDATALIAPDVVAAALRPGTILVSIMHANNEVGTIQPIRTIADLAHAHGAAVHCDAVQSLGRIPVNVDHLGVDLLAISGHKLGGPNGVGALYARKGTQLAAMLVGGSHERERRAGTENMPGIAGFARAVEIAVETQPAESQRLTDLKMSLWKALVEIPCIHLNGDLAMGLPNTLNISFEDISGEDLMQVLDLAGIAVSTGSACAVGASKASHVIEAMGGGTTSGCGPLRVSMGYRTAEEDIVRCSEGVKEAVLQLRESGQTCCCPR